MEAEVKAIEYDPNRTCRIALLEYKDGVKAYILAPVGLGVGDKVMAGDIRGAESRQCPSSERHSARLLAAQCRT